ncbi:MAG TPA: hypothetical protein VL500_00900 [Candidatus Eisenbacteria bacterium]|nr:hypothetical protein [Candidatus Eisenbacteria bacterium]
MIVRDYEAAKAYAANHSDERLVAMRRRYDRIGSWFAYAGLLGFLLLFGGGWFFSRVTPGFAQDLPGLYGAATVLLPALCIAGFLFSGQMLDRRRGIIDLARQLQREAAGKEE